MTRFSAPVRLAVLAAALAALGGCLPIMFDRDGNWRGQQPTGPAYESALDQDEAAAEE